MMNITPRFSVQEIIDTTIKKDWFRFQESAFRLGVRMHAYMIGYINKNRNRRGGGNLAKSINFESHAGAGLGMVSWGIGNITKLASDAPYWYWANYGGQIPGGGAWRPAMFGDGRADASYRGKGVSTATAFKTIGGGNIPSPARPINYIQATRARLDVDLMAILAALKRG